MATNKEPMFENTVDVFDPKQFTSADASARKSIAAGGAEGSRIDSIMISSNDTAAVNLAFYYSDGVTDYYIGNVQVPIGSGYTTVARVDGMTTLSPILGYLIVPNGWTIKCNCVATMTAAKVVDVVAMGGDF